MRQFRLSLELSHLPSRLATLLAADGCARHSEGKTIRKILIVDDHAAIRIGLRKVIASRPGLEVAAEAGSSSQALAEARSTKPEIAIVDLSIGPTDGIELTYALKRELPAIEVLVYTMHSGEAWVDGALRAGAGGYVLKSDPVENLLAAIDALSVRRPYFSQSLPELMRERLKRPSGVLRLLTRREREVVKHIAEGNTNKLVGEIMGIALKTVETHRGAVMHKLELRTTAELVRYAIRNQLVEA